MHDVEHYPILINNILDKWGSAVAQRLLNGKYYSCLIKGTHLIIIKVSLNLEAGTYDRILCLHKCRL